MILTQKPKSTTVTATNRTKHGRVTAIFYLLMENNSYLLQEDTSSKILIQDTSSGGWAVKIKN
jgi:hypothetical protein